MLSTGLTWLYLPPEVVSGSGITCRRLREQHEARHVLCEAGLTRYALGKPSVDRAATLRSRAP